MTAGQRIYQCRKKKKLSQEYVATVLGVSRQAVSKWENDLSVPDTMNYINLAKIFGVSVEYLVFGEEENATAEDDFVLAKKDVPKEDAAEEDGDEKVDDKKSEIMLLIGFLLFLIGVVVILLSIFVQESFFLFLVGVLSMVLAKKVVLD